MCGTNDVHVTIPAIHLVCWMTVIKAEQRRQQLGEEERRRLREVQKQQKDRESERQSQQIKEDKRREGLKERGVWRREARMEAIARKRKTENRCTIVWACSTFTRLEILTNRDVKKDPRCCSPALLGGNHHFYRLLFSQSLLGMWTN